MNKRFGAVAVALSIGLSGLVVPTAHAQSSFDVAGVTVNKQVLSSDISSDGASDVKSDNRWRATVLHYGVTTQEEVDRCVEESKGKAFTLMDRGYDFPCPRHAITEDDVNKASKVRLAMLSVGAPLALLSIIYSILALPFQWLKQQLFPQPAGD